ncbi:tol-pal system protein YbgF [Corticibacter populi]|nr:tol-pal system protein YbgF [Corticibacter populi]
MQRPALPFLRSSRKGLLTVAASASLLLPGAAHALFEDGDARRAILELRGRVDQLQLVDQNHSSEIQQMRSSLLELQSQISSLRSEIASLRGEKEELTRELQQFRDGVDGRLKQFEPAQVQVDGAEFSAQPAEQQAYEAALDLLRNGDYARSRDAFTGFLKDYPQSGYAPSARFWLGNSYYATRQYQQAIDTFNAMLRQAPQHERAPEAALSIANSQIELKNVTAAKQTLQNLINVYPNSDAAGSARERLARLR